MSAISVTFQDTKIYDTLQVIQMRMGSMQPALHDIGVALEAQVLRRFELRLDPQGKPWKRWSPSTIRTYPYPGTRAAHKAGKPGHGNLLDRYGDMLDGFSSVADDNSVRLGFDRFYATYHEYGVKVGGKERLPRRGMVFADPERQTLSAEDEQAALAAVQQYLRSIIHGD